MDNVINSLNRLNRAGSEHGRTTQKVTESAMAVLGHLYDALPDSFYLWDDSDTPLITKSFHEPENSDLFRGYELFIRGVGCYRTSGGTESRGYTLRDLTRDKSLEVARLIASGLIERVTKELETQVADNETARLNLENAA